jgi:hypothetical protein
MGHSPSQPGPRRAGRKGTATTRRRDDFAATVAVNGPSDLSPVGRATAAEVRAGPGVAGFVTTAVRREGVDGVGALDVIPPLAVALLDDVAVPG